MAFSLGSSMFACLTGWIESASFPPGGASVSINLPNRGLRLDLSVDVEKRDGFAVLNVAGEVDVFTAPKIREQLIDLVEQGDHNIIVSLEGVDFLDSTGLGVLVAGLKRV